MKTDKSIIAMVIVIVGAFIFGIVVGMWIAHDMSAQGFDSMP
jgi:uncharacterized protein YneF (UPF0154 family)